MAMTLERMERMDAGPTGPPVLCAAHVQGLGRGLAGYGAQCNDNARAVNTRGLKDHRKAEAGPIKELDMKRLVSSKVSSTLSVSFREPYDPPMARPPQAGDPPLARPPQARGPPRRRNRPSKTPRRQVQLSLSVPCILYITTHAAFRLKTQVPRAHRYRALDVRRASADTVQLELVNFITEFAETVPPRPPAQETERAEGPSAPGRSSGAGRRKD